MKQKLKSCIISFCMPIWTSKPKQKTLISCFVRNSKISRVAHVQLTSHVTRVMKVEILWQQEQQITWSTERNQSSRNLFTKNIERAGKWTREANRQGRERALNKKCGKLAGTWYGIYHVVLYITWYTISPNKFSQLNITSQFSTPLGILYCWLVRTTSYKLHDLPKL